MLKPVPVDACVSGTLTCEPGPGILVRSAVDLGVTGRIDVRDPGATMRLEPLSTFAGCHAPDPMRGPVAARLAELVPNATVRVEVTFDQPSASVRIAERHRVRLDRAGFGTRGPSPTLDLISLDAPAPCPDCGCARSALEKTSGAALCRPSSRTACRHFKAVPTRAG